MKVISSAGFIFFDKKLLIAHPTEHSKDYWNLPKGKMEAGESALETLKREVCEETGIIFSEKDKITYLGLYKYIPKKKDLEIFVVILDSLPEKLFCDSMCESHYRKEFIIPELDEYKWIDLSEYDKYFRGNIKTVTEKVLWKLEKEINGKETSYS
jgi:8-oxo-dGTP pyrophosphatase MutT (NUDIX family)